MLFDKALGNGTYYLQFLKWFIYIYIYILIVLKKSVGQ